MTALALHNMYIARASQPAEVSWVHPSSGGTAGVQQLKDKLAETQAHSSSSDAAAQQQLQEIESLKAEAAQVKQFKEKLRWSNSRTSWQKLRLEWRWR
eukprot:symbB.v1.2.032962.t1/scaffold3759.1/size89661/8